MSWRRRRECSAGAAVTMHRRTGLILAGITGTLLIASVFVVPVLLNADRYRPRVISYLEEGTGNKVEIGRVTVSFFPKLTIHVDDLGVKSPPLFPSSYILKVARIDVRIDPWALLVLERPLINLVSDRDGPWNFENPGAKDRPNSFLIGVSRW